MTLKRATRILGLILMGLAVYFFIQFTIQHAASFPELTWDRNTLMALTVSTLLYLFVILVGGVTWHLLLHGSGESRRLDEILAIFAIAQFAKYIPGNVGQHVGRIALSKAHGLRIPTVVLTMIIEIAWSIVASSVIAIVAFLGVGRRLFEDTTHIPALWQLVLLALVAILVPIFVQWIFIRWRPGPLKKLQIEGEIQLPRLKILAACLALNIFGFFLMGSSLSVLAQWLFDVGQGALLVLTGTFCVAWVAGFITPGAPAGLGIRDAILLAVLGVLFTPGRALGIALVMRAVTTVGDGLAFIAGWISERRFPATPEIA
jgi:hypothetical protein